MSGFTGIVIANVISIGAVGIAANDRIPSVQAIPARVQRA
jgi:hypothetical protein